jgi:hypothetical protein
MHNNQAKIGAEIKTMKEEMRADQEEGRNESQNGHTEREDGGCNTFHPVRVM